MFDIISLINDMPVYSKFLNKKGKLLMSGFFMEDSPEINEAASKAGLINIDLKTKNRWVVSVFTIK